jgi:cyanate permease
MRGIGAGHRSGSLRYPGWRVVIACFTMTLFGFGFGFYGHSVYLAELTMREGANTPKLTTSVVSAATTAYYLLSALLIMFVSDVITRFGPRLVATAGAMMLALSLVLVSRIRSPVDLFVAYLAMAPAFATLTNAAVANILGLWFIEKRGLAMSLALTGGGVGGVVIAPLLVWLNGRFSFTSSLQIVAGATIPILLATIVIWVDRPVRGLRTAARASGEDVSSGTLTQPITRRRALVSAHFWTIATPLALGIAVQVGFIVHQVAFLFPSLGREAAGAAVLVTASMAVIGRVGLGLFVDRLDQRRLAALLLGAQACALFVILQSRTLLAIYLACAVFGFGVGNMIVLPSLMVQREYPAAAFGMLSALVLAIVQVTNAMGPILVGGLRDATGSYALPIWVCMSLELAAAAIVLLRVGPAKVVADARRS